MLTVLPERLEHSCLRVEALVRDHRGCVEAGQKHVGTVQFALLSRRKVQAQRVCERIDDGMDFGAQPALAASDSPARKPRMHHAEVAKSLRQIASRNACPVAVQHSLHKHPVVPRRPAFCPNTPRQQILDPIPLIVPQSITPRTHTTTLKPSTKTAKNLV